VLALEDIFVKVDKTNTTLQPLFQKTKLH